MSVDDVLAGLNPNLRKAITKASEIETPAKIRTPSVGMNLALNGGLQLGRQVLVWGSKSSSKSSTCLQMVGMAQEDGYVCAWIDAEMSYDTKWAERLGVNNDELIYSKARTINDMVDVTTQLIEAGVDVIVIDSISALLPAVYFEKNTDDLKQLEDTKQIGAESRDFGNAWKMINYINNKNKPTLVVAISQARNNINAMYTKPQPMGGNSTMFYSSTIIKLFSSESENKAIDAKIKVGDKVLKEKVGRVVNWDVQFNKTSAGFQSGEYEFYFKGDMVGVDTVGELIDEALKRGVIARRAAYYDIEGSTYQGKPAASQALRDDPELLQRILAAVNGD